MMRSDPSGWQLRSNPAREAAWRRDGAWRVDTLATIAPDVAAADPDRVLLIDGDHRLSAATLLKQAHALAGALHARGLRPGHVVSFQLPNWHEAAVINLAASLLGLVVNPLVPIYREAELRFMLADCRSRILFVPEQFRGFGHAALAIRLQPELSELQEIVVLRGTAPGCTAWDDLLAVPPLPAGTAGPDPDVVKLVMYTSGTTGRPKGVLHSHNTIQAELRAVIAFSGIDADDVVFMPSPVTHVTGFFYALEMPWAARIPTVMMESWNAVDALRLVRDEGCTLTVAATPFLVELLAEAERAGERLPRFRSFTCGGASVPPELIRRVGDVLERCRAARVYGSTECPTITNGVPAGADPALGASTDGSVYNNEVRIVDPVTGQPMASGEEGEIIARGPENFLGYARTDDNQDAFDADGFFRTGDLGWLSEDGYLTMTGRRKDLIIRGGENISPREIEDVLFKCPGVQEVAVVAMPHPRLGEGVCAFVVPREGATVTAEALMRHVQAAGIAKQKWPERLEIVTDLPRTASGKVRKNILRDKLAEGAAFS